MFKKFFLIVVMIFINTLCFGDYIQKNINQGQWLILDDGSLWEVDPLDRIDSYLWLAMSEIMIVDSNNGSLGYDYLIINTDDKEKVHARPIKSYEKHWLNENAGDGSILILEDDSIWKVDEIDTVDSGLWLSTSNIYVVEVNSEYILINADDGESVHANPVGQK